MTDRPRSRRIIYGGKLPGVIYIGPQKSKTQELLDRMDRAWTAGAEEILSQIQKEGKGDSKPKIGPSPVDDKNIEISKIKIDSSFGNSTGSLGNVISSKIASSFGAAASARRAFKKAGGDPTSLRRGYFLSKALGTEFGGDFIRRTKGTFDSAPDATTDPGLSKGQRFEAVVNRDLAARPQMVKQGELLDVDKFTDKSPFQLITDAAKKTADKILGLESEFVRIEKSQKETSASFEKIRKNFTDVKTVFVKTSNNFKEFIDSKEETLVIKDKIRSILRKGQDAIKSQKSEQQLELQNLGGEEGINVQEVGLGGNVAQAQEQQEDSEYFGGADLFNGFGSTRRRGAGRTFQRGAIEIFGKRGGRIARNIGNGVVGQVGRRVADVGRSGANLATRAATSLAPKAVVGFLRPILKRVPIVGGLIDFVVSLALGESPGRAAAKAIGATVGAGLGTFIPIPVVGTLLGGVVGDLLGGTIYDAVTGGNSEDEGEKKLASGGIIAGEAGNEIIQPLTSAAGREAVGGIEKGSMLPVIGTTLSVIAGLVRNPFIAPFIAPIANPIIQPLLAKYNVPVFSGDFGPFNAGKAKAAATKSQAEADRAQKNTNNPLLAAFGFLGNLFKGIGGAVSGAIGSVGNFFSNLFGGGNRTNPVTLPPGQVDPGVANMSSLTGIHKQAADLIAGYESSTSGGYNAMNRGTGGDSPEGPRHYFGKNLTDMTIGEVINLQSNRGTLNAAGRYQFVGNTLPGAAARAGLSTSDKYSPLNQDKMFVATLRTSGHRPWTGPWGLGKYTRQQLDILDRAVSTPVNSPQSPAQDAPAVRMPGQPQQQRTAVQSLMQGTFAEDLMNNRIAPSSNPMGPQSTAPQPNPMSLDLLGQSNPSFAIVSFNPPSTSPRQTPVGRGNSPAPDTGLTVSGIYQKILAG